MATLTSDSRAIFDDVLPVDLALQGGHSHGAFTWGALDRFLEESQPRIEGNPMIASHVRECASSDTVVVQVNQSSAPVRRAPRATSSTV